MIRFLSHPQSPVLIVGTHIDDPLCTSERLAYIQKEMEILLSKRKIRSSSLR